MRDAPSNKLHTIAPHRRLFAYPGSRMPIEEIPGEDVMAIYELRQYQVREGQLSAWLELMEGEIIPFQTSQGVVVSGSFSDPSDETLYFWIRRFENQESMKAICATIYESDHWNNVLIPRVRQLLVSEGTQIRRLEPTALSVLQ